MRHIPLAGRRAANIAQARRALRIGVCKDCDLRPPGSESLGADTARSCEGTCKIFCHLPQLVSTAEFLDPMIASLPRVMTRLIDDLCERTHEPCAAPAPTSNRQCPLSRYRERVIDVLQRVVNT